jgi:hypothetical protein
MATMRVDQSQQPEHAPAVWLAFFRARPDLAPVAFGYGVLVAVNRLRRHARKMHESPRVVAPAPAQLDDAVRDLVAELRGLGHLTAQPRDVTEIFTREAERLLRGAPQRYSWGSLASGCRRFTALFAGDFTNMVDEVYAAAFAPLDDADEATQAAFNVCQAAWAALEEAGHGPEPRLLAFA